MEKLKALITKLEDVRDDMESVVKSAFEANEEVIVSTVRDDQLYDKGVNGFGVDIDSYDPYAASTIKRKQRLGQPTDRVTLKDTGDFYKGFFVEYYPNGFKVTSTDYKAEHLADRYGSSIFALTSENRALMISSLVRPEIIKKIKNG